MNSIERNLAWFLGGLVSTAALSWIAFQLQQEQFTPAVLFPVLVGAVLAAVLLAILRITRNTSRSTATVTAIVWGLSLVVGQDYIGHRHRLRQFDAQMADVHPLAAAAVQRDLRPTFAEHLTSRFQARPVWWSIDALLTAATAGCVVAYGTRRISNDSKQTPLQPPCP